MARIFFALLTVFVAFQGKILHAEEKNSPCILVTGGAGFIGSHVNKILHQNGYQTVILDRIPPGKQTVLLPGIYVEGDIDDAELLDQIFTTYPIDAVMHFAALIEVGESVTDPIKYYRNNVASTIALLDAMYRHKIQVLVFSSSAAIFGMPAVSQVVEDSPYQPINPYGQTKLMIETILHDMDDAYGLRYGCLRYFNVAGGDPEGELKNHQKKALNLIPIVLRSLQKTEGSVTIFGTDYPTSDGTCVRDYIHVVDLASAHIASLEKLLKGAPSHTYNLGNGRGYSVREVIAAAEKVTGLHVNVIEGAKRAGDSACVIANPEKAFRELGWSPQYSSIEEMVAHAWLAMQPTENSN